MTDELHIRPLRDYMIVEHDLDTEQERASEGGIVIPAGSYQHETEIMAWGRVVRVGPGRWDKKGNRIPLEVKAGDRVCYNRFLAKTGSGESIRAIIGEKYALIQEKDVVAFEPA